MRPKRLDATISMPNPIDMTLVCGVVAVLFSIGAAAEPPVLGPLASPASVVSDLDTGWHDPPLEARTRAFWWWLNGNVTKAAITRDLEQMKAKGMGGGLIFDADGSGQRGNRRVPAGPLYGSDAWRALFVHAVREAERLGLELSLSIQSGWNLGGPTVTPHEAAKQIVWSELTIDSPGRLAQKLPQPSTRLNFYRDIAVLGLRTKEARPTAARSIRDLNAKSMFRELGGSAPDCRRLLFDIPAIPGEADVAVDEVVDLSDRLAPDGTLQWTVPEGAWSLLRFGYTPTSSHVSTASGDWQGLVVDYMSEAVLRDYWRRHIRPMLQLVRPQCGAALKYVETDSWECGGMNWTPGFEKQFQAQLGYDPVPWLPVLAGKIVEDRKSSNAFLADFRKAIAHAVAENNYRPLAELAHEFDLGTQPEAGGPHAGPLDGLKNLGRSDLAMSEFWRPSPHRPGPEDRFFVKQAASAAHTYGIQIVGAEGFTSIGPHWNDSFWRDLKPSFDHEACDGLNLTFIHTFTCSPTEAGLPGQEYFAGTHFNPNCTWWPMAGAFVDYMNRCHWLLQQGRFVADVAYYYGDHAPNIARSKADDPARVLPGYDYDVLSEEILGRLSVRGGVLRLPTGLTYHVLVLPDHRVLSLGALRKVRDLVAAGATVVGPKPERAVSLVGGAEAIAEFTRLARDTWDAGDTNHAIEGVSPTDVLRQQGVGADFSHDGGQQTRLAWIHRVTLEGDLYFVANQSETPVAVDCSFRVSRRQPELWDAMDGSQRDAAAFAQENGRTIVPLHFAPHGSIFVLFRRSIPASRQAAADSNSPTFHDWMQLTGPWKVRFDPAWGGPESIDFDTLTDWSKHTLPGVKYYSGMATYEKRFTLPEARTSSDRRRVYVDLGNVLEMAELRLNDRLLGVLWAPPFRLDVTDALKPGENVLEIRVANQWTNRIIGDLKLPPSQRRTRTNITRLTADSPLLVSGLLGPVRILQAK